MASAVWNGAVIAQSDDVEIVEGNVYFPRASVDAAVLEASDTQTVCGWKGTASYFSVVVDGERLEDAAWTYPEPKAAASAIAGHVAFWKGVEVSR